MNGSLPPVEAPVLVAAVDGLPARLRRKLDDAVAKFGDRAVTVAGDRHAVEIDESTTVTLVTHGGVVRSPDDVTCTCLLAPNCLHRAAVLALAPVDAGGPPPESPDVPDAAQPPAAAIPDVQEAVPAPTAEEEEPLSTQQAAAVAHLWRAAVAVLSGGVTGSGAVARTALLRAAHDAQACKVYRPAAAARVVATLLQAARTGETNYRLADLTDALRELLGVTHRLRTAASTGSTAGGQGGPGLLGSARRQYQMQGSLRLHGLCTTAVLAGTGHAGVVTYVVDRRGGLWMIADLMPGDARRAAKAGNATVAMGETALSHRALARAGLVVSGATASPTRQLGAGRSVRAVTASGAAWHEEPLAALWAPPAAEQVHRAFEALARPVIDRVAGSDLLFLRVRVRGTDGDAVFAEAADGTPLTLRVAAEHPALGYRENLRVLGRAAGLEMLLIGRPDPGRRGTVFPLAVAPPVGVTWPLPEAHGGHVDLAFDRLYRSSLPAGPDAAATHNPPPAQPAPNGAQPAGVVEPAAAEDTSEDEGASAGERGEPEGGWQPAVTDPALHLMRAQVERTVSGGRVMLTFPSARGRSDTARLRRARLEAGAALLERLAGAARDRPRDAFGRLADDDGTAFAQAWLAAAAYNDAANRAFAEATWLPGDTRLEATH